VTYRLRFALAGSSMSSNRPSAVLDEDIPTQHAVLPLRVLVDALTAAPDVTADAADGLLPSSE
jgi:hypothetical protein